MSPDLFFENKKYISTKAAATLSGYSNDYVGQLCRGNKIDSRRIGRVWYVSEESILNHKKNSSIEPSRLAENFPQVAEKDISPERESKKYPVNETDNSRRRIKFNHGLFLNGALPKGPVFFIVGLVFVLIFIFLNGQDSLKVSERISLVPVATYSALNEVADFYSTKLSGVYVWMGNQIIDKSVAIKEKGIEVLNNPALYIVEGVKYLSKKEVRTVDTGASKSVYFALNTKQKAFSFISDSVNSITVAKKSLEKTKNLAANVASAINPLDNVGVVVYQKVNSWFERFVYLPASRFFATPQVVSPTLAVNRNTSINTAPTKIIRTTNVIEKTIERVAQPDITRIEVDNKLQELNNKLMSEFSRLSTGSGGSVTNIYREIAQLQVISNLHGVAISEPTITGGSISGTSINASSLAVSGTATFNSTFTLGNLNGPLQANNGVVSATTSVGVLYGGTGLTTAPTYGDLLVGNSTGGYTLTATSSLGIIGGIQTLNGLSSLNQTFSTSTSGGLNLTITSAGADHLFTLSPATDYNVPLTASTTNWNNNYDIVTASSTDWNTAYLNRITSASLPLSITNNAISISQANTTTDGYLSSIDWRIFNNKVASTTSLTAGDGLTGGGDLTTNRTFAIDFTRANTWTGLQQFTNASSTLFSSTYASSTNAYFGTLSLGGTDLQNTLNSKQNNITVSWPITLTGVNLGWNGLATSSAAVTGNIPYFSGVNTFANVATTSLAVNTSLSSSGTLGFLIGGGNTTLSLNMANANSWGANQTFALSSTTYGSFTTASTTNLILGGESFNHLTGTGLLLSGGALTLDTSVVNSYIHASTTIPKLYTANTWSALQTLNSGLVVSGNTTLSSVAINSLLSTNASGQIVATSTPTFGNFNATSTNATSTIAGGLAIGTSKFVVDYSTRNVGIGTATPQYPLHIVVNDNTALRTFYVENTNAGANAAGSFSLVNNTPATLTLDAFSSGNTGTAGGIALASMGRIRTGSGMAGLIIATGGAGDPLIFATHDLERMRIDDTTGNVGIGTSTPLAKLNILSTGDQLRLSYDASHYSTIKTDSGGNLKLTSTGKQIYLGDSSANAQTLNFFQGANGTAGNMATIRADWNSFFLTNSHGPVVIETATDYDHGLQIQEAGSPYDRLSWWFDGPSAGGTGMWMYAQSGNLNFKLSDAAGASAFNVKDSNSVTKFTVLSSGNVGIGTTSPYRTLSVGGSGVFTGGDVLASTFTATSSISTPSLTLSSVAINSLLSTNAGGQIVATSTPTFGNFNATSTNVTSTIAGGLAIGTSKFVVDYSTGNVGIGTTDVGTYKLNVNGTGNFSNTLTASAIKLTSGATDGYFLRSDASGNGAWTSVAASQIFKGTWDASLNTPTLADGTGTAGWYYRVVVGGTRNLGSGDIAFIAGDDVSYNGTIWQRIPSSGYTLVTATPSVLGGIKVGGSLQINSGVLDINNTDMSDITVSGTGTDTGKIWTIDNSAVTYAKIQNVSAQYKVLGRTSAGAGTIEELSMTGTGSVAMSDSPVFISPTVSGNTTLSSVAINSLLSTNASGQIVATSTPTFGNFNATSTNATSTIAGGLAIGTSKFVVDYSTGNVGIGTASPAAKLDIVGGINLTSNLQHSGGIGLTWDSNLSHMALTDWNDLYLTTTVAGKNIVLMPMGDGNVGIGTSTPYSKLSVWGGDTLATRMFELTNNASTTLMSVANNGTIAMGSATATTTINGGLIVDGGSITHDWQTGETSIDNLSLGAMNFDTNAGTISWVDMPVSTTATAGDIESYTAQLAGNPVLTIYGTANGAAGGVSNIGVGIGTTTPSYLLTVASSTAPQLSLSAGAGIAQWAFRNAGGNLYFATTTVAGTATTSISALEISGSGFGTTTVRGLNISGQATSTSNVGWNITSGCYGINGNCLSLTTLPGILGVSQGGTGQNLTGANGVLNFYSGVAGTIATSSLGLLTANVAESGNLYYTAQRVIDLIHASTTIPKTYTTNTFTALQTFNGGLTVSGNTTLSSVAINSLLSTNASGQIVATSTPTFGNFNATSTNATSTIAGGLAIGTSKFVVDYSTGNVGIGTTNPGSMLEINTLSTGSQNLLRLTAPINAGNNPQLSYTIQQSGNRYDVGRIEMIDGGANNYALAFSTWGTLGSLRESMRIDKDGNVGIGTTSPSYKLDVSGNGRFTGTVVGANATLSTEFVTLSQLTGGTGQYWSKSGTNLSPTTAGDDVYLPTNSIMGIGYDPTTLSAGTGLAISGNVGIGTTEPAKQLQIEGGAAGIRLRNSGVNWDWVTGYNSTAYLTLLENSGWPVLQFRSSGPYMNVSAPNASSGQILQQWSTQDGAPLAAITDDGNVGIGTTTPGAQLTLVKADSSALTDFLINPTAKTSGNLIDAQVNGISKFKVDYAGLVTLPAMSSGSTAGVYAGTQTLVRLFQAAAGAGGQSVGQNVFVGNAGNSTMTNGAGATSLASYNTAIGYGAFTANTTGNFNTSMGWGALVANTTGTSNVSIGAFSLYANQTNQANTAVGMYAGYANTADNLTAVGYTALMHNTTGAANTAVGTNALAANTMGYDNTALGYHALTANVLAHANTALGKNALATYAGAEADGSNTAVGWEALKMTTDTRYNTALGSAALVSLTGGSGTAWSNTAIGHASLYYLTTGASNTALGDYAGAYITGGAVANTTSGTSVYLGTNTKALTDGDANEIVIGYGATGIGSNSVTLGNDSIVTTALKGNVGIGTTTPATTLDVFGRTTLSTDVSTYATPILTIADAARTVTGIITSTNPGDVTNGLYLGTDSSHPLMFGTAGAEQMRITTTGNVGIGTVTPVSKLDVLQTSTVDGSIAVKAVNTGITLGTGYGAYAISSGASAWQNMGVYSSATNGAHYNYSFYGAAGELYNSDGLAIGDSTYSTATIPTGGAIIQGNVGIGTTVPGALLDIKRLAGSYGSTNPLLNMTYDVSNIFKVYMGGDWSLNFDTTGGLNNTDIVFIPRRNFIVSQGNVGIGTSTPAAKLDVNGVARVMGSAAPSTGAGIELSYSQGIGGNITTYNRDASAYTKLFLDSSALVLNLNSGGNVGIGTTEPSQGKLQITVDTSATDFTGGLSALVMQGSTVSTKQLLAGFETENNYAYLQTLNAGTSFSTYNLALQPKGGNVGIGTTEPSAKLEILNSTDTGQTDTLWLSGGATAYESGPKMVFHDYFGNNSLPTWRLGEIGAVYANETGHNTYGGALVFNTNSGSTVTDISEKMRIQPSGNVGIGTTAPLGSLSLGNIGTPASYTRNGVDQFVLQAQYDPSAENNYARYADIISLGDKDGTHGGGAIRFLSNPPNSYVASEWMRITQAGNVGIGTTVPNRKLELYQTDSSASLLRLSSKDSVAGSPYEAGLELYGSTSGDASSVFPLGRIYGVYDGATYISARTTLQSVDATGAFLDTLSLKNGNVGIGTTTPASLLSINNTSSVMAGAPSLTHASPALLNLNQSYGGTTDLVFTIDNASPFTASIQHRHSNVDGLAYPIALNPNGGNVGIGTTIPTAKLSVQGNQAPGANVPTTWAGIFSGTGATNTFGVANSDKTVYLQVDDTGYAQLSTYDYGGNVGFPLVLNANGGNVGIGTTTPATTLDVFGRTTLSTDVSTYATPILTIADAARTVTGIITSTNPGDVTNGLYLGTDSSHPLMFGTAGAEQMRITTTGNVGIGTTNPIREAQINGTGQLVSAITDAGNTGAMLLISQNDGNAGSGGAIAFSALNNNNTLVPQWAIKSLLQNGAANGVGDLAFSARVATGDTALTERVRITSGGNVGIGTTTPWAKLSVNNYSAGASTAPLFVIASSTGALATSTAFIVANNGNVGIGTAVPGYPLDVTGSIRGSSEIIASNYGPYGQFRAIAGNYGIFLRNDSVDTQFLLTASADQYGSWNTLRPFKINNSTGDVSLGNSVLTVKHGGNVGIGTTTPGSLLSIGGNGTGWNFFDNATTTSNAKGINLANGGCFAVNGVCVGGTTYGDTNVNAYIHASTTIPKLYTANTFTALQTLNGGLTVSGNTTLSSVAINSLLSTNASGQIVATSTPTFGNFNATSTNATSTIAGGLNIENGGFVYDYSSGNVGIGTAGALARLHSDTGTAGTAAMSGLIYGSTQVGTFTDPCSRTQNKATLAIGSCYDDSGGTAAAILNVFNYDGSKLYVRADGNVGIGTTSPDTQLQVVGAGQRLLRLGNGSGTGQIYSLFDNAGSSAFMGVENSTGGTFTNTTAYSAFLINGNASDLQFGTGGAVNVTIKNGGNVGIGTTVPLGNLDVRGVGVFQPSGMTATRLDFANYAYGGLVIGAGDGAQSMGVAIGGTFRTYGAPSGILSFHSFDQDLPLYQTVGARIEGLGDDTNTAHTGMHLIFSTGTSAVGVTERMRIQSGGNVGIGTTTPATTLDVFGRTTLSTDVSTYATPILTIADAARTVTGVITSTNPGDVTNGLYLGTDSSHPLMFGTAGAEQMRITTTGSVGIGTTTPGSLLSIGGNGTGWNFFDNATTTSSAKGINLINGGCFAVNGTCLGGGSASLTGTVGQVAYFSGLDTAVGTSTLYISTAGNVGVGSASPISKLHVEGTTTASGANAIAGLFASTTLTNSTASGFQFGNRMLSTVNGTVAGTEVGTFIRMTDNTSLANTTRGLEVQAYSGTNTSGVNTGIATYGKTFGIQAFTTGLAGGVSTPAAVYAELMHSTSGNAIRAYSAVSTTATLLSIYQETSAYTGTALAFDLGNGAGSFGAGGNFIDAKVVGTSRFSINNLGNVTATLPASTNNFAVCHETNGAGLDMLKDCSGAPSADYQEIYPTEDSVAWGDVLTASTNNFATTTDGSTLAVLTKVAKGYDTNVLGVAANPADSSDFNTIGYNIATTTHQSPVALKGRVKVKFSSENGVVKVGDFLTSSALMPGFAMKATRSGQVIGQALEDFAPSATSTVSSVLTFINIGWQNINNQFVLGEDSGQLSGNVAGESLGSTALASFLINQKGSGNILQLQSNGMDRFMVATSGAMSILSQTENATDAIVVVKNNSAEVFSINARGDVAVGGVIIVKDDNFAGSIATNADGVAEINFTYNLGTGKPVVELTPESDSPVFAQVSSWKKDGTGNYTGFTIKTFGISGAPASAVVHYLVTGKKDGYATNGQTVTISTAPSNPATISPQGSPVGTEIQASTPVVDTTSATTTGTVAGASTDTTSISPQGSPVGTEIQDSTPVVDTTPVTPDITPVTDTTNTTAVIPEIVPPVAEVAPTTPDTTVTL